MGLKQAGLGISNKILEEHCFHWGSDNHWENVNGQNGREQWFCDRQGSYGATEQLQVAETLPCHPMMFLRRPSNARPGSSWLHRPTGAVTFPGMISSRETLQSPSRVTSSWKPCSHENHVVSDPPALLYGNKVSWSRAWSLHQFLPRRPPRAILRGSTRL